MRYLIILSTAAALAGCFAPDLGTTPFRCAAEGKKCPDDYVCVGSLCVLESSIDASVGDVRPLTDGELMPSKERNVIFDGAIPLDYRGCLDASSEPNDSRAEASSLSGSQTVSTGWAVCPARDVDQFAVELTAGQQLKVVVDFKHKDGDLDAALLDTVGVKVDVSKSETDNEELLLTSAPEAGTYIVVVYGFGDAVNEYSLKLTYD